MGGAGRGPRDTGISAHSAVCVMNGEAVDTTCNTPVLMYDDLVPMAGRGSGGPGPAGGEAREVGCR